MIDAPGRVLVTAVGGDGLGQGIVKALRAGRTRWEIHGSEAGAGGVGAAFVHRLHRVPHADEGAAYVDALDALCAREGIAAVVPASEPEMARLALSVQKGALAGGARIISQDPGYVSVYGDKLHCYRALEGGVPLAPHADASDPAAVEALVAEHGFPVVVKPRRGSGSRALSIVRDESELPRALAEAPLAVVQAYVDDEGGEFSVGVFRWEGDLAAIAFRRKLGPLGSTWFAETVDDPDVLAYAAAVAHASGAVGSINVQVRKSREGVRLLEINPRFSSLVAARAYAGFRDVEWSLRVAFGLAPDFPRNGYRRLRYHRFVHEMVDTGNGPEFAPEWLPRPPEHPVGASHRRRVPLVTRLD